MSKQNPAAKAIKYMIDKQGRWDAFTPFLDDGRICLTSNAAERALRGVALGCKSWLFPGSERGGDRAAFMNTLIVTAKMNDIDPQAWLADVLKTTARNARLARARAATVELENRTKKRQGPVKAVHAGCLQICKSFDHMVAVGVMAK